MAILFLIFSVMFVEISAQAQMPSPAIAAVVPPAASLGVIGWLAQNWGTIASALLLVSEGLAMVFPATTGFGGILAGIIKFTKGLKVQPPSSGV